MQTNLPGGAQVLCLSCQVLLLCVLFILWARNIETLNGVPGQKKHAISISMQSPLKKGENHIKQSNEYGTVNAHREIILLGVMQLI